jgi:hypothetical protein
MTKEEVEQKVQAYKATGLPRLTALRLIREEAEAASQPKGGADMAPHELALAEAKARLLGALNDT